MNLGREELAANVSRAPVKMILRGAAWWHGQASNRAQTARNVRQRYWLKMLWVLSSEHL
jgi:hypothetical protein